jgi:hypothetical protein
MERDRLDKMLDEWLDQTVAEFGRAQTRPGFEERIVAGLHNRMARGRLWFRWQALAAAATVAFVFLFCVIFARFTDHGGKHVTSNYSGGSRAGLQPNIGGTSTSEKDVMKPLPKRDAGMRSPHGAREPEFVNGEHAPKSLPRQDVFPSARLSNQDRLILDYVRSVSSGNIAGFMDDSEYHPIEITQVEIPKPEISKLEIEPIRIEPLP